MKNKTNLLMMIVAMTLMINGLALSLTVKEQTLVTPSATLWINSAESINHTFLVTTTGVSTNIIFKIEGSKDGTNYVNLDDTDLSFTVTGNKTTILHKDSFAIPLVRLNWSSKSGTGTTPNVKLTYIGGR